MRKGITQEGRLSWIFGRMLGCGNSHFFDYVLKRYHDFFDASTDVFVDNCLSGELLAEGRLPRLSGGYSVENGDLFDQCGDTYCTVEGELGCRGFSRPRVSLWLRLSLRWLDDVYGVLETEGHCLIRVQGQFFQARTPPSILPFFLSIPLPIHSYQSRRLSCYQSLNEIYLSSLIYIILNTDLGRELRL